jgi:hypothetical protein
LKITRSLIQLTSIRERKYFGAVGKWDRAQPRGVKHAKKDDERSYNAKTLLAPLGKFEGEAGGEKRRRKRGDGEQ